MSMIGKTLGNFECTALLGKGGMGEVYRAKDQKLGRDVAIKVLPEEFAKDADRVARFQREAKLLASLNHPNIAAIYGLEESDGPHFLVMELVEGVALEDYIAGNAGETPALPAALPGLLKLALQIAEALEAAHEKGVIHRDLKPANIKVTPDGKVKVLDFGLAKAFAGEQSEMILSDSPTLSVAATQQGIILGTAAYMSPEQAKGMTVDKRADVWAFGCVVFEMLTGRSVFAADDVSQTLARVLEREPDFLALPQNLHPKILEMLDRCMEKDVKNRYSSISDARVDIQKVLADPGGVFVQPVSVAESRTRLRTALAWVASVILAAVVVGFVVWNLGTPEPRYVHRFDYDLPEDQYFQGLGAISADGTKIVYRANQQIYLKNSNELEARPIRGFDEYSYPRMPFFSTDGRWIGYFSPSYRQLKKIPIGEGTPIALCSTGLSVIGASWCTDDTIVYSQAPEGVMRISADGGTPESLLEYNPDLEFPAYPQILPDGKTLLVTRGEDARDTSLNVELISLESKESKLHFAGGMAKYLSTGHIVYLLNNNLFAVRFDLDTLEIIGDPESMIEGVDNYMVSDSGTLVYVPEIWEYSDTRVRPYFVWVDQEGNEEPFAAEPDFYRYWRISPDGTQVAFNIVPEENNYDIWILDTVHGTKEKLTSHASADFSPLWNPDSNRIVFGSGREGGGIYWMAANGTGEVERLFLDTEYMNIPSSWSGDGKMLILMAIVFPTGGADIEMMSMEGDRERIGLLQEEHDEANPRISPDGRWMAYQSNESGDPQIYIRSFPDMNMKKEMVSTNGGRDPLWSPDGSRIFYRNGNDVLAVTVETEPTFELGKPEILFTGEYDPESWDIHPDDRRFLMLKEAATTDDESAKAMPRKINIVLNWDEELKERVPVP